MASNEFYNGQEVWINNGLDKGKKGVVTVRGFDGVRVQLDAETKFFTYGNVTTQNPHTIPLPPNFLPLDHALRDRVEISGHPYNTFNGITGTVTKLPTSTSYRNGGDKRYGITVTKRGNSAYAVGETLYFEPQYLKAAPAKRVEGEEIAHADVQIGDTIRVEYRSGGEGFRQVSSKEGRVTMIQKRTNSLSGDHPATVYTLRGTHGGNSHVLNYGNKDEKITLVKAAPDIYVEILSGLKAGTTVIKENNNGTVTTYVKAPNWVNVSQWHVISSNSTKSSSFARDGDVIEALRDGAEFVHKVRK